MSVEYLIWFLLIGLAAGWIASIVMKSGRGSILQYMIIGVIGALLGGWLFSLFGIGASGLIGSLITATVGAVVLIALLRLLRKA
ncbi:MAG TPA: GlsB/YeaQ/YmgE family stress response membrane protein [Thermoanaerobaculia bacterium]|nr:GlsB/YeaQ/YmgE family stress response membrane protein [Thermoanaerobaculia bacterium]